MPHLVRVACLISGWVCQIVLMLQCPVLKHVRNNFSVLMPATSIHYIWPWNFSSLKMDLVSITFGLHASFICCLMLTRLWGVGLWLSWDTICHSNVLWLISSLHSWFFLFVSDDFIRFGHALSIKTPYGHVKRECRATPSLFCSAKIYPSSDIISGFSRDMDHLCLVGDLIYNSY